MSVLPFLLLTTLGSLIWNTGLVYIGAAVGASWGTVVGYMNVYSNVVYSLFALSLAVCGFIYIRKRVLKSNG